VGSYGIQDFAQGQLDVLQGIHAWEAGAEYVSAAEESGGILAASMIAEVVVTELFASKGRGAAGDAIFFEMVAGTERHGDS
jgi:hypothetical protein